MGGKRVLFALLAICCSLLPVQGVSCPSTSPLVGTQGHLRMIARQLRGTVVIKNDCEFEVLLFRRRCRIDAVKLRRCRRFACSK